MRGPFRDTFFLLQGMVLQTCIMATSGYVELEELFESHDFQCLDPLLWLNVVLLPGLTLNRFRNERSFKSLTYPAKKPYKEASLTAKLKLKPTHELTESKRYVA